MQTFFFLQFFSPETQHQESRSTVFYPQSETRDLFEAGTNSTRTNTCSLYSPGSQFVLDTSSGKVFFLVWCPTTIVWLARNLLWAWLMQKSEEFCCTFWVSREVWNCQNPLHNLAHVHFLFYFDTPLTCLVFSCWLPALVFSLHCDCWLRP